MIRSSFCAIVDLLICWGRGEDVEHESYGPAIPCLVHYIENGYCISSERDKNFSPNLGEEREGAGIPQQKKALVLNLAY